MRPSEVPNEGVMPLGDGDVADWLEARPRAALLFWDASDAVSQKLRGRVELVAASVGLAVGAIDVRSDALVAQALGVTSVPTTIVFRGGEVVERVVGSPPDGILRDALQ